jgi:hypothetical protein
MASVTARNSIVCDAFSVCRCDWSCWKSRWAMIDSSIIRLVAAGMNTPATATSLPLTGMAVRIHLPLAATSILTARPVRDASSKKRSDGSATS